MIKELEDKATILMFLSSTKLFVIEMLSGECSKWMIENYKPGKDDPCWKQDWQRPKVVTVID